DRPDVPAGEIRLAGDSADKILWPDSGGTSSPHEQACRARSCRTATLLVASGGLATAAAVVRRAQFDLWELFFLADGSARLMRKFDRGERHLEEVELLAERLHHSPEGLKVVLQQALPKSSARQLQAPGAQVRDGRQLLDRDRLSRRPFDGPEHPVLARLDQGCGGAFAAGPANAPDAMHVQLRRAGHVVVHYMRELLDVEAAC